MKSRHYDHIDLRVRNVACAKRFYRPVMKALGFTKESSNTEWTSYYPPPMHKELPAFFGFTRDPKHKPNGTRIAFWAASRAEVDRVAKVAKAAGARNIEGPGPYDLDSPNYYAVFFEILKAISSKSVTGPFPDSWRAGLSWVREHEWLL